MNTITCIVLTRRKCDVPKEFDVILFCSDPLEPQRPDQAFGREAQAAEELAIGFQLVDFEALTLEQSAARAIRRVKCCEKPSEAIYRGWMLKPEQYRALYEALLAKNVQLINDPAAYGHCHYLPESYPAIEDHTPRSVWMKVEGEVSMDEVMQILHPFGSAPVIVKDFVKSRKHEWNEACFIPSAADRTAVERVVRRFLELQGDDLNEGLIFREFIEFEPLATHSQSGMPLTQEFRLFFLDGRPILCAEYWDEGEYRAAVPPVDRFIATAHKVRSRFFTMDIANRSDGDWMIVELGDGQVAGLPDNANAYEFYRAIAGPVRPG